MSHDSHSLGTGRVSVSTDKALLIEIDDLDAEVWIPKSAIHSNSEVWKIGQEEGDVVVHRWFAEKEGWCD